MAAYSAFEPDFGRQAPARFAGLPADALILGGRN
jgi:hypothetical protein